MRMVTICKTCLHRSIPARADTVVFRLCGRIANVGPLHGASVCLQLGDPPPEKYAIEKLVFLT